MTVVLTALAPVVLLIALGYGLRRSGLAPDASWSAVERLTYFVLFPALLVSRVSAQGVPTGLGSAAAVTVMTVLAVAALLLALRPAFRRLSGPAYTALFQGGVRFNTYLSFAMAEGLLGAEALAPLAWLAAVMILMINVLCVLAFARWGQGKAAPTPGGVAKALGTNPLFSPAWLGVCWRPCPRPCPAPWPMPSRCSEVQPCPWGSWPWGRRSGRPGKPRSFSSGGQQRGAVYGEAGPGPRPCGGPGRTRAAAGVLLMLFCVPTATSAYILAQQLGGDGPATAR